MRTRFHDTCNYCNRIFTTLRTRFHGTCNKTAFKLAVHTKRDRSEVPMKKPKKKKKKKINEKEDNQNFLFELYILALLYSMQSKIENFFFFFFFKVNTIFFELDIIAGSLEAAYSLNWGAREI